MCEKVMVAKGMRADVWHDGSEDGAVGCVIEGVMARMR